MASARELGQWIRKVLALDDRYKEVTVHGEPAEVSFGGGGGGSGGGGGGPGRAPQQAEQPPTEIAPPVEEPVEPVAGPPRTSVRVTQTGSALRLTNEATTQAGIGHPVNTGTCGLSLNGIDAAGKRIPGGQEAIILPGASMNWFRAAPGAVAIVVEIWGECASGSSELSYDIPIS